MVEVGWVAQEEIKQAVKSLVRSSGAVLGFLSGQLCRPREKSGMQCQPSCAVVVKLMAEYAYVEDESRMPGVSCEHAFAQDQCGPVHEPLLGFLALAVLE